MLVYLGVDNNFHAEAAQKIETLTTNWNKNNDGNLLIYSDAGGNAALIHIYYNPQKGNVADTIITYPDENSANPQTLTRVLNDVKNYRPANSYGLVVLSHATGWLPVEMSKPTPVLRSIIWDTGTTESYNYMELADFAEAIPYHLDFIIFDACFMGSVEVCYELKDKTDYIVASPAEVVSPGFVYSTIAQHLFQPQPDLTAVARDFYEYFNNQSGLYRSATVSVVKTAELENLKTLFQGIAGQARNDTGFQDLQCFGYGSQKIYFDLGDCIQKFAPEKHNDFQTALDQCVIYKAHTDSYYSAGKPNTLTPVRAFSGLSVYVPQAAYPEANEACKKLKFYSVYSLNN
ncbi:clostripain [Bacteroidia bacterium]|nr:clostripain [Bacteroidia bacterium]